MIQQFAFLAQITFNSLIKLAFAIRVRVSTLLQMEPATLAPQCKPIALHAVTREITQRLMFPATFCVSLATKVTDILLIPPITASRVQSANAQPAFLTQFVQFVTVVTRLQS